MNLNFPNTFSNCPSGARRAWSTAVFCLIALLLGSVVGNAQGSPFKPELLGEHPRLLFDAAELEQLRVDIQQEPLASHYARVTNYLGPSQVPSSSNFQTNATEAQRQGLWRMPTVALHFALTGSTTSRDRSIAYMEWLYGYDAWELGGETNSGMAAANMMVGAALSYDLLYHELDPTFREQFRQKLLYHAEQMYARGHAGSQGGYWQVDPLNNHRQHRDAGLVLATLAAYEGNPDEATLLQNVYDEVAFLVEYLPADGSSHESTSYQVFGGAHLTLALQAADNCFGTSYLDSAFYQNVARFRVQSFAPGLRNYFMFGDMSESAGAYNQYNMFAAARHGQADLLAALDEHFEREPYAYDFGWMGVVWRGTWQPDGSVNNLPLIDHFEDLGLTFIRDGWGTGDAAAMFKCGPLGGYSLNDYRNNEANGGYVNVAHDDLDANAFILFKDGEWVAETDRYSHNKRSANLNTILVDGKGQRPNGRPEGPVYAQPGTGRQDMTEMAFITWQEDNIDTVISEGEASGSYAELDRFRRSFIWRTGEYILMLDDIRAPEDRQIEWLIQSDSVITRNAGKLKFTLQKNSAQCQFHVAASESVAISKQTSPADHRNTILGWQQMRLTAENTRNVQFATVFDLWDRGNLEVSTTSLANGLTINVSGNGIDDTWTWEFAPDNQTASSITLNAPPTIVEEMAGDNEVAVNEQARLAVQRGGLGPVNYEWFLGNPGDTDFPVGVNSPVFVSPKLDRPSNYWVRISNAFGTVSSEAFTVELSNGFYVWARAQLAQGDGDEHGDYDADGMPNLVEYALDLDADRSDTERPAAEESGDNVTFRFTVPENALMDIRYEVQVNGNLDDSWETILSRDADGPWSGEATFSVGTAIDGSVPVSVTLEQPQFVRLKITRI